MVSLKPNKHTRTHTSVATFFERDKGGRMPLVTLLPWLLGKRKMEGWDISEASLLTSVERLLVLLPGWGQSRKRKDGSNAAHLVPGPWLIAVQSNSSK